MAGDVTVGYHHFLGQMQVGLHQRPWPCTPQTRSEQGFPTWYTASCLQGRRVGAAAVAGRSDRARLLEVTSVK